MMRYINYHKHTHYSNLRTLDSVTTPEQYIKRAVELGHKEYFTTEHGFQGNIFEAYTLCQQYGLKCVYGVEAYYVDDLNDKSSRTNYHIVLIAMTEKARREINKIMSAANREGFYYKPRIDLNCLLSLTPTDTVVTTACIASRMFKSKKKTKKQLIGYQKKCIYLGLDELEDMVYAETDEDDFTKPIYQEIDYEDQESWLNDFLIPVYSHFKNNFYLEVQAHVTPKQAEYNKKILEVSEKYNIKIIHANDSHYIYPEDAKNRDLFLKAKEIAYQDEDEFVLDYPDYDTILDRYAKQGVLSKERAEEALKNTLIFDESSGITLDKEFKIPKISKEDGNKELKKLINTAWKKEKRKIPAELHQKYISEIQYEYKIVEDCGMADYFVLDHYIVKRAVEEYGAVLTRSGRGSAVSFYINKLLGLTEIDRISAPITLYPTRFMSAERILSSRSLPDIDLNFADVKPVIRASKDYLGEDGVYYMIAYKPLQESSAFRLWCKAHDMHISEYDDVAKNLDAYVEHPKWKQLIEDSKAFIGVIESVAPSPCSFLLSNDKISEMVGLIRVGEEICCCLDGYNCDVYKFLKNDYLTVTVWTIIEKVYNLIGKPIDDIPTLLSNCGDEVWELYAQGLTTTINQADSDYDKQILKRYKPHSIEELSAYVAAIRPGFASLLENFVERKPYSTGVKELDNILEDSFHYLMYQESIMKYLVWLGIEEKGTYDIIKKIAKKKFKDYELEELKEKLFKGWMVKVGNSEGFDRTWQVVMDAAKYSFNASHSLSVAIDSLYGAYLKANYPLEYYTVALSNYADDMDRTSKLTSELPYFGITLLPIQFRHSRADYSMDKANNAIYKGISSIKYLSADAAEKLYEMRDMKFDSFIDFLEVNPCDARQTEILIMLNFFQEFGKRSQLMHMYKTYDEWGGRKQIPITGCPLDDVQMGKCSTRTAKLYKITDPQYFVSEMCRMTACKPIAMQEVLKAENEYLGYLEYKDKRKKGEIFVLNVDTKYSPVVTGYTLDTGKTVKYKISKNNYRNAPVSKNDIIKIYFLEQKPKSKKMTDGTWSKSATEYDTWISSYAICY